MTIQKTSFARGFCRVEMAGRLGGGSNGEKAGGRRADGAEPLRVWAPVRTAEVFCQGVVWLFSALQLDSASGLGYSQSLARGELSVGCGKRPRATFRSPRLGVAER